MDSDERLIELKRAYADAILNTTREAAARIAVSESKAVRLEKELNASKGEALQMLLRLKKMMDFKVTEAEMMYLSQHRKIQELSGQLRDAHYTICKAEELSLSQQKKIEELEAQLSEAEDIVKDLREELKGTHAELERFRKDKSQYNGSLCTATKETEVHAGNICIGTSDFLPPIVEEKKLDSSQPIISPLLPVCDSKNSTLKQRNDFCLGNLNDGKPYIPSILLKSKGTGFFANRRTQRIRAFEEKLMAGELSFTDGNDQNTDVSVKEDGKRGAHNSRRIEKNVQKVSMIRRKCRNHARHNRKKTSSIRDLCSRDQKIVKFLNLSCAEPQSAQPGEDPINNFLGHEKVKASDEEFIKSGCIENNTDEHLTPVDHIEKIDTPVGDTEMKTPVIPNGIGSLPVAERMFKYTFQRKRKRKALSVCDGGPPAEESTCDGGPPAEESFLKKCITERQNGPSAKENYSSIIESSRDSRRVEKVALQLISLSDKKWWS